MHFFQHILHSFLPFCRTVCVCVGFLFRVFRLCLGSFCFVSMCSRQCAFPCSRKNNFVLNAEFGHHRINMSSLAEHVLPSFLLSPGTLLKTCRQSFVDGFLLPCSNRLLFSS